MLAAETHNEELRRTHGLTVLTYSLQHPSLTRPWFQAAGREMMRRIFGQGEDWEPVLLEGHPRGVGRQRSVAAHRYLAGASECARRRCAVTALAVCGVPRSPDAWHDICITGHDIGHRFVRQPTLGAG